LTSTIPFDPDVFVPDFVGGHRLQLGGVHQGDGRGGNQEQGASMQDDHGLREIDHLDSVPVVLSRLE
jgi:hypothetical protein